MRELYSDIFPYATHRMDVGDGHTLFIEECGNPVGIPIVFLHGGPGGGCQPWHRRFFDPDRYRIILFDQRGCGRSTPYASLEANTTAHLVADMERIRDFLNLDQWLIFGGSWGSTLGLVYAETYPNRVLGLILRGIFLCRKKEIDWFYQAGANKIFPDYWKDFIAPIPKAKRDNLLEAYYQILTGQNEVLRMGAAKAWSLWEGRSATLIPNKQLSAQFGEARFAMAMARIEAHYFYHQAFLEANQVLDNAHHLAAIPGSIVHGRYDLICPLENAFDLHQAWPGSELQVVEAAGHAASESAIRAALVEATDAFADSLT